MEAVNHGLTAFLLPTISQLVKLEELVIKFLLYD